MIKNVVIFAAGAGIGYFVACKKLEAIYAERSQIEIAEAREFYKNRYDAGPDVKENEDDIKAGEDSPFGVDGHIPSDVVRAMTDYQGSKSSVEETKRVLEGPRSPYVITEDEYMDEDSSYEQNVVTYFESDSVVIDHIDQVVPNSRVEQVIGSHNLRQFGQGSNDENVIYVRCEQFMQDFEVNRSKGKYSVDVLGLLGNNEPA